MKKVTRIRASVIEAPKKIKLREAGAKIQTTASGTKFKIKGHTS